MSQTEEGFRKGGPAPPCIWEPARLPQVSHAALPRSTSRGIREIVGDYLSLLKPRIVVLLVGTAVLPMVPAAHGLPRLADLLAVVLGGVLAAGGAHAIN